MSPRKALENREEQILQAAIRVFSKKGYSGGTTSEIAKEANISEGTIFRYFRNKKEILNKIIFACSDIVSKNFVMKPIKKIIQENKEKNYKEILKRILKDRIEILEKNSELIIVVMGEIAHNEEMQNILSDNISKIINELAKEMQSVGNISEEFKEVNLKVTLRSILGMIMMHVVQKNIAPELIELTEEEQLDNMVEIILYGVVKK